MLGSHAPTAAIGSLNFDFVLLAHGLDLLILCLQVLKLHRLHLNRQRLLVYFPKVDGFLKLVAVELDELDLEGLVDCHVFRHRRVLPLLEVLRDEAAENRDKGRRGSFLRLHHGPLLHLPDVPGERLEGRLGFRV